MRDLASFHHLVLVIPGIAVISGVDTRVGAPVNVLIVSALGVEDVAVGQVYSLRPDAGTINLRLSEEVVAQRAVAESSASLSVLVVSAVAPRGHFRLPASHA